MHIRLGTRQSPLALWQANHVTSLLEAHGHQVELVKITTAGDVSTTPLGASGGVGVFTKEIQRALLDHRCDLAVHSLKDLPTEPVQGLQLTAVPPREVATDALLARYVESLEHLPTGAKIGTGSPRRRAQLLRLRKDLEVLDIRGNVDTRIRKMEEGEYDAIVLASAGLHRLGLQARIRHAFTFDEMIPAIGQAALGLETRAEDTAVIQAVEQLTDPATHYCVQLERSLLRSMRAGCLAPLAGHATILDDTVRLSVRVFSPDASEMIEENWVWPCTDLNNRTLAEELGAEAARDLIEMGAEEFLTRPARL